MSQPTLAPLAAALLLALPAAPGAAAAQSPNCPARRGTHISIHETGSRRTLLIADGQRCFEARGVGDVEFADDDGDVRRLAPGGSLTVEETSPGGGTRRAEYADRAGAVERRYFENGRAVDPDAGAAWARPMIARLARESLIGAEARARRIARAGGARAVLDEVGQIASDGVKRVYLTTLLAEGRLSPAELAGVARAAGRSLASDGDKGRVLRAVLETGAAANVDAGGDAQVAAAVVDAAGTIASDGEKGRVLAAAATAPGADARTRAAAVRAANGIASDRVKADLLTTLGPGPSGRDADAARAAYFDAAGTIASDAERRRVLLAALEPRASGDALLASAPARDAFFRAADAIASDRERGAVLRAVVRRDGLPRPALLAVLRSAGSVASDRERADVLLAVAERPEALRDDAARRAFFETTRGIASSSEYRRVMDAVVR